jgi:mannose-6-phosphate isomerase
MPILSCPLQLSPVFKPKIWGRNDLAPLFPSDRVRAALPASDQDRAPGRNPRASAIGEVWLTGDEARFSNGPVAGMTLGEVSAKYPRQLHGESWTHPRFPILAKYIFTSDWLSVQVHPSDEEAQAHDPGERGKCEMWYVLHAARRGGILLGLKPKVTREALRAACQAGRSRELLNRIHPQPGKAIFVPPGTVHALGPGLVLFEIQENSDLTYRLDDFGRPDHDGRPRPLHLDKGLAVTRPELPPHYGLPRAKVSEPYGARRFVLACPFFALEELTLRRTASFAGARGRVETYSVLEGCGRIETPDGWLGYRSGETWIVPPETGEFRWIPRETTRLLKFYVPDVENDFRRPLARHGVRAATIRQLVFD